jgi:NAD-dependent SIR2 family protein deacetylase
MHGALTERQLNSAADAIDQADGLLVTAGAGMGIDSGLPDFRGNTGFWTAYPALGRSRTSFFDIASPDTFRTDPRLAWGFYGHRLALYRDTVPHDGFQVLRRWIARKPAGGFVFTSNVDGQFQRAGLTEAEVHEHHGSLHWLQCLRPCSGALWSAESLQPDIDTDACRWRGELPACPQCGGLARPNVLMFGDDGWLSSRTNDQAARLQRWLPNAGRIAVVELGAGTQVPSVRLFSEQCVRRFGASLIRINPREPEVPLAHGAAIFGLAAGALDTLRALDARGNPPRR